MTSVRCADIAQSSMHFNVMPGVAQQDARRTRCTNSMCASRYLYHLRFFVPVPRTADIQGIPLPLCQPLMGISGEGDTSGIGATSASFPSGL